MPAATTILEVLALFGLGALVFWPALRRFLPQAATPATGARSVRFEPKDSPAFSEHAAPTRSLANESLPQGLFDEEFDDPFFEDFDNAASDKPLPLSQALLRGERAIAEMDAAGDRPSKASARTADNANPFKVLVVDRREKFRTAMLLRLARSGHRVYPVANGREALEVFSREHTDLVLIHRDALCEAGSSFPKDVRSRSPYASILVHGGRPGAGDVGRLKHGVDITVIANAGDNIDVIGDMIDCSLAASRCIRDVREDQHARGKVLSELSYNLRSALDVISGYTDIMSDDPSLAQFQDMLQCMRDSTTSAAVSVQMQSDVDVALDVAEQPREERVELASLSERLRGMVGRQLGSRQLQLTTSGPIEGCALFTDGEKLLSILAHVIADAVRCAATGQINVAVRSSADRTEFVVTDAVPGTTRAIPLTGGDHSNGPEVQVGRTIAERISRTIGATVSGSCNEGAFTVSVPSKLMTPSTEAASRLLH